MRQQHSSVRSVARARSPRPTRAAPGERLPSQAEIAAAFECSLTPVKRALLELEHEGLIVSRQGVGVFVADLTRSD
jgi:GntR family transcriptional repressor for pyruvate dehydrogenase complex